MIAFLGLGRMGVPMAGRLVAAGHKVAVWNRTPRDVPGAEAAPSPAAAAADADIVITMLSDPGAVSEVVRAALPGLRPGSVLVEMSTIGPDAVERLRGLLPEGVSLVDAPVLGSVGPAAEGTLVVLAGGRREDLDRVSDVLRVFGTVHEAGGPGAGAATKLAVMSALVTAQVGLAETLAYADALGVGRTALLDVLGATPLAGLAQRLRPVVESGPFETSYALGLAVKDLRLATEGPGSRQTVTAAARDLLAGAVADGLAGHDLTAVVPFAASRTAQTPGRQEVRAVNPASVPATNGYYSHAVRLGDLLFVSGQVALDEDGKVVGEGDMTRQSEVVMENLGRILADQGSSFDRILHIRTFLTDMDRLPEYAAVRSRFITGEPPASTTVEVGRLFRPGLVIEIEVVAAL
ncbi:NAD(P)-binding domain-containing protein [Microbispora sp. CA-135349]|uniref:NAD(P)-binding domain-containing protein n=1 Tax=Microbispora sp. CA-135349 TaxID=3239953 RepID=UPI003D933A84